MNATKCTIESGHKYLIADGNGGFKSVKPYDSKSFAIVNGTSITIGWKFEEDGPVVTELYEVTDGGNVKKVPTESVGVRFMFRNKKTRVTKCVYEVRTGEEKIFTDEATGPWLTEEGVIEYRNGIEIPDGTYPVECNNYIVVNDDCRLYSDDEHAAWYSEPTIDGKSETCRAKLLDLGRDIGGDDCQEVITRNLSALKVYAECNNIKLWYDTDSNAIRAVKVPDGYDCTIDCDHKWKDQIPWELMPVVGHLYSNTYGDSDYQMGLVKKPDAKEGDNDDR